MPFWDKKTDYEKQLDVAEKAKLGEERQKLQASKAAEEEKRRADSEAKRLRAEATARTLASERAGLSKEEAERKATVRGEQEERESLLRAREQRLSLAERGARTQEQIFKSQEERLRREGRRETAKDVGKFAGAAAKALTAGGYPAQRASSIYFPKTPTKPGSRGFFGLESPAKEALGVLPSRGATTPSLEPLRSATPIGVGQPGSRRIALSSVIRPSSAFARGGGAGPGLAKSEEITSAMSRLRGMTMLKGPQTSSTEQLVVKEVSGHNGGGSTLKEVADKLSFLGIPRSEVMQAISGLLGKNVIRQRREFGSGPVLLEVNR